MAVAAYTIPELTQISDATTTTNWSEPTSTETQGGSATAETDYFIQGTGCISKGMGPNGTGTGGLLYNAGSGQTISGDNAFFIWWFFGAPNGIDTLANGGGAVCIGSSTLDYKKWYVLGSDNYAYGGWKCIPVDPDLTADATLGTPNGTLQYFGFTANLVQAVTKGNPFAIDIIRHGRGTLQIVSGDATAYGTFVDAAGADQATSARWGLCQLIDGTFVMQGHFLMGVAATAVDFRDSGRSVVIANTLKVNSGFNLFEIRHALSRVDWSACNFLALGTVSRGNFLVTDNADVNIDACSFTDMGTFTLLAATAITNSTLRSCDTITAPGSDLRGTSVFTSRVAADAGAVVWNVATNPDGLLDNMTFSKGTNAHHAIDFGTSVTGNITLRGIEFTGFGSTADSNDSTVRFLATTGSLTLSLVGCTVNGSPATTSNFSVDDAAGIVVTLSINPVTFSVTVRDLETTALIEKARVMVPVTTSNNFPYLASVSITGSGTTATVTHTTHGLATNDNILIAGATEDVFNGAYTITLDGVDPTNKYTYTAPDTLPASASGTITATMVLLNGFTNASGIITDSRTYGAAQTVSGWVRRHTYGPSYTSASWTESTSTLTKTGAFTGMSGTFLLTITAGTNMTPGVYLATYVSANAVTLPGGAGSADSSDVAFTIGAKPLYRQAPVVDTISATNGLSVTVFLQSDE